jgi:hypothetical protein
MVYSENLKDQSQYRGERPLVHFVEGTRTVGIHVKDGYDFPLLIENRQGNLGP